MRPKTKDDAQKITLTLSGPSREILMKEAMRRGVSRTQVVEDLINGFACENPRLLEEGKSNLGAAASVIHEPFDGGSEPLIQYLPASKTNLQAK
jgi:hypothetical protein